MLLWFTGKSTHASSLPGPCVHYRYMQRWSEEGWKLSARETNSLNFLFLMIFFWVTFRVYLMQEIFNIFLLCQIIKIYDKITLDNFQVNVTFYIGCDVSTFLHHLNKLHVETYYVMNFHWLFHYQQLSSLIAFISHESVDFLCLCLSRVGAMWWGCAEEERKLLLGMLWKRERERKCCQNCNLSHFQ